MSAQINSSFVVWFALLLPSVSCTSLSGRLVSRPFEPSNRIAFKTKTLKFAQGSDKGPFLSTYSNLISPLVFSQCKNAPSDSRYLGALYANNCSPLLSLVESVARVLREHDLAFVSKHSPFSLGDHLVWPDNPKPCYE